MDSSPVSQRIFVALNLAMKNSGKFNSTLKWLGMLPSISITQANIPAISGLSISLGSMMGTRANKSLH
jgi:hypothetical protein